MSLPIFIANRFSKILGAFSKVLAYPFHTLFKHKRFTIPEHSEAFIKSTKEQKIRKTIWQTNYTNKVSLPVYINYFYNRLMSLDYEYRYVSTQKRMEFLKEHASKTDFSAFSKLTDGAAQADFWRVFVLNFYGGVYMDIDANLVWPLSKIIKPDDTEVFLLNKQHYTNYFIASQKNNPILQETLQMIVKNIEEKKVEGGVYELTGPTVLNHVIGDKKVNYKFYRFTCVQGSFTNEYFQYIDKPRGKWTYAKKEDLLQD